MVQLEETKINSFKLFKELREIFENPDEFDDIKVEKKLQIIGDDGKVAMQWYPTKWYKNRVTGVIWSFDYPDFPAQGSLYKLDENGVPVKDSIFYFENRRRKKRNYDRYR